MIYLVSPYSHPDPAVREQRFRAACQATVALLHAGQPVYSPIVHSHPLVAYGLPTGWDFWSRFDWSLLARCDEVVVLMLPGWEASAGVCDEVRLARVLGKPVRYLAPELATGTPTLARVAAGGPEADPRPTAANATAVLANGASEVRG